MALAIRDVSSADPAAGGELVFTADEDLIVRAVYFVLVTSAVVANRRVSLVADDGTLPFFRAPAAADQAASQTVNYSAYEGATAVFAGGVSDLQLPARGLPLRKGDRLLTATVNRDAGDDFGPMRLEVDRL